MKLFVATKNAGKLRELEAIFAASRFELATYGAYADVAERSMSYVGNAVLKARALAAQLRNAGMTQAVLADDSGLEVEALDDRPGVRSARYGGIESSWPQRRARLLAELRGLPTQRRGARFVCVMAALVPGRELVTAIGVVEGLITEGELGDRGFGYDPIFFYPPRSCTFAQLSDEEKNAISHRRRAADALLAAVGADD